MDRYGGPEALRATDLPEPEAAGAECLVEVHAAGVNPVDCKIREGRFRWGLRLNLPYVPGSDLCGRVVGRGPDVSRFAPGDWIVGSVDPRRGGSYAELAVVPVDRAARKPESLAPAEAAALPIPGTTALQGFRDHGRLEEGDSVLVIGASGGVGHLAVQIARRLDARVVGVCSGRNADWVRELGADRVVDYTRRDYTEEDVDFDVVFDTVAVQSYWSCQSLLAAGGTYVTTVPALSFAAAFPLAPLFGHRVRSFLADPNPEDLARLGRWADEEELRPRIEREYPLEAASAAHERSESGRVRGKLVLRPR